ncbi:cytosine permease [Candidatus Fukatsuia symbiotica]|uniref:Cytosine permease n=1 Tax=Candidatus Fukatsuia symbiotica TaxID=1878942 RepID=A0A2U8I9A9_9GAMM|nr:cytosine permease [Candidatus Fukatsuia symbiotica]AWK15741.1 cytosine permease [Candidatus Fukatsuia symbiotica]MEA9446056.1 cytosine permease [Candidatus Fukatsuia symbiotica]
MINNSVIGNDYAFSRVPLTARSSLLTVTLIRIGVTTALAQFMLGATLGHSMTFSQAMLATFFGSLIVEFVGLGLGIAGAREGLSTSLLARWCGFGRFGSVLIGLAIAISTLCWFGVQNSILAKGLNYASDGRLGFGWASAISGISLTVLVIFGFRALGWTAKLAVPLFFLVIGWIMVILLQGHNVADLVTSIPTGVPMTLGAGATAVAGGVIVSTLITPDISRYCQNGRHVFWMVTTSIVIGEFIVNGIAILIAHALDTDDVVSIMTKTAGWIGLLSVILSAVKINDVNLYSVSLALTNVMEGMTGKKWSYIGFTLAAGIIGTVLSIIGILDKFTDFLILLGVVFPPIAGVMLVDYYILRTNRQLLDTTRTKQILPDEGSTPLIGWPAMISWVLGGFIGFTIEWGIPSLNSLFVASVVYLLTVRLVQSTRHNKKRV